MKVAPLWKWFLVGLGIFLLGICVVFEGVFVCEHRPIVFDDKKPVQGIGAYVINLDRSRERLAFVLPRIEELGVPIERISAVDGRLLSEADIRRVVDLEAYNVYIRHFPDSGTIGCSLSHFRAWEAFLRSSYAYALIFEDDVSFASGKLCSVVNDLTKIPQSWDLVRFDFACNDAPFVLCSLNKDYRLTTYFGTVFCAGAYLINRRAATALCARALPVRMSVDYIFSRGWEFDLKFVGLEPKLVHQTFGDSEIKKTARFQAPDTCVGLIQQLRRAVYRAKTHIMYFLYNMKLYIQLNCFS